MAILAKLNNDAEAYNYYRNALSVKSLSLKRKLLLLAPIWISKLFLKVRKVRNVKTYYPLLDDKKSS